MALPAAAAITACTLLQLGGCLTNGIVSYASIQMQIVGFATAVRWVRRVAIADLNPLDAPLEYLNGSQKNPLPRKRQRIHKSLTRTPWEPDLTVGLRFGVS